MLGCLGRENLEHNATDVEKLKDLEIVCITELMTDGGNDKLINCLKFC